MRLDLVLDGIERRARRRRPLRLSECCELHATVHGGLSPTATVRRRAVMRLPDMTPGGGHATPFCEGTGAAGAVRLPTASPLWRMRSRGGDGCGDGGEHERKRRGSLRCRCQDLRLVLHHTATQPSTRSHARQPPPLAAAQRGCNATRTRRNVALRAALSFRASSRVLGE